MRLKIFTQLVMVAFLVTACLPQNTPPSPFPLLPATQSAGTPTLASEPPLPGDNDQTPGWVEYRDARYGYGLALPCFWQVYPTPSEGNYAAMVAKSYSDEFFAAHSERGNWRDDGWPEGAYKLDAVVIEGITSSLDSEIAVRDFIKSTLDEQELASFEKVTYGRATGYLVVLVNGLQGGGTYKMIYYPIRTDALLGMSFQPDWAMESPEIKAVLASLALSGDEPVVFPDQIPSAPPDGGSPTCQ